ncbi:MAG: hypothetical protein WAV56_00490 [Microgenomates group bacterium]
MSIAMLDLNRLKNFIRTHPRFFLIVSGIIITGFIIFLTLLARPTAPLPIIGPLITPTPTPTIPAVYAPPTTIDLSQAESVVRVGEVTTYIIPPTTTIRLDTEKISSQFQLPTEPETINTQFIQVQTWNGPDYYLNHNLLAHQIALGRNDESKIARSGTFRSPAMLAADAISLVNSLQVFAPETKFKLERFTYFSGNEWPEPSSVADAQFVELILTPQINNLPVYQQEIPFISAAYDRANKLLKLAITNPIPAFTEKTLTPIATTDQLQARPSTDFFRLFVKPETSQQYFLSAPDITALTPNRLSLGLYLENSILSPIYLLQSSNYLYATKATP